MKLPAEIRRSINQHAHAAGLAHGEKLRLQLIADAETRVTAGEPIAAILDFLQDPAAGIAAHQERN